MAKEVITRLVDDLDGSEAAETVEFGLDGRSICLEGIEEGEGRYLAIVDMVGLE